MDSTAEQEVLTEARKRLDQAIQYETENRSRGDADIKIYDGQQWDADVIAERKRDRRPYLTFNKLPQFVDRVVGDQRQNKPAIKVKAKPLGQVGKLQEIQGQNGKNTFTYSEVMEGLIRDIEQRSQAEDAYDLAFEHQLINGYGNFRVLTEYMDDDSFEQDVRIRRIINPNTVYWDPLAEEYDKSDANWAFVTVRMSEESFKAQYPGEPISADVQTAMGDYVEWYGDPGIRVAEYYRRVPTTKKLLMLSDGRVVDEDEVKDVLDELTEQGIEVVRERTVNTHKVEWVKMSGLSVLEGPTEVPCKYIPIIFVGGKELHVDGKLIYRSLIRNAHDAQRQYNYQRTSSVERTAIGVKSPFIAGASQISGYRQEWEDANNSNATVLTYNDRHNASVPQRVHPPSMSEAEYRNAMIADDDLKSAVGMYDASIGNKSNEQSGRAILARDRQSDAMSYTFVDNLAKSIRHCGRVLCDMIPRVYDTDRIVRVLGVDGEDEFVPINQTVLDEETGEEVIVNDLSAAKYIVSVDVGPSFASQRIEAADSMIQFLEKVSRGSGEAAIAIAPQVAKNMDWPGSDELYETLRKLALKMGLVDPTEEELVEMQQKQAEQQQQQGAAEQQVDPIQQMGLQVAEREAQAKIAKADADIAEAAARQQGLDVASNGEEITERIDGRVREMVADYLAEFEAQRQNIASGATRQ